MLYVLSYAIRLQLLQLLLVFLANSVVPDIAAAADHPYPPWRYRVMLLMLRALFFSQLTGQLVFFFLQIVECRLFQAPAHFTSNSVSA